MVQEYTYIFGYVCESVNIKILEKELLNTLYL